MGYPNGFSLLLNSRDITEYSEWDIPMALISVNVQKEEEEKEEEESRYRSGKPYVGLYKSNLQRAQGHTEM